VALKFLTDATKLVVCWYVSNPLVLDFIFPPWHNSTPMAQSLLILGTSRSHSDTPQSVGVLWTSDQSDTETT
jgi:hypothetical protein